MAWLNLEKVQQLASSLGWRQQDLQDVICFVSFSKEDMQLNVYYSTGTVSTAIKHPKKGRTQLFRRNVSFSQLEELFKNPRLHTGKGYYTRYEHKRYFR